MGHTLSKEARTHRLLSPRQVAGLMDLKPRTIARWCREGRIPAHKWGRVWRIKYEDYRRLVDGGVESEQN